MRLNRVVRLIVFTIEFVRLSPQDKSDTMRAMRAIRHQPDSNCRAREWFMGRVWRDMSSFPLIIGGTK